MLYTELRPGQRIVLETPQGPVVLEIVHIDTSRRQRRVQVGISADRGIRIDRSEVHEARQLNAAGERHSASVATAGGMPVSETG